MNPTEQKPQLVLNEDLLASFNMQEDTPVLGQNILNSGYSFKPIYAVNSASVKNFQ